MATNNAVNTSLSGQTGTGSFVGSASPTLTGTPVLPTPFTLGATSVTSTGTQLNYLNALTGVTGSGNLTGATSPTLITPILGAATATSLTFNPTTGGIVGTTTNNNADAGKVGEVISSSVLFASAVSLSNNTAANVTSISLTAGDWDVWGNVFITASGASTVYEVWSSNTSATAPDVSLLNAFVTAAGIGLGDLGMNIPYRRVSLSGTTTVYLSCLVAFSTGACTACGNIFARRAR